MTSSCQKGWRNNWRSSWEWIVWYVLVPNQSEVWGCWKLFFPWTRWPPFHRCIFLIENFVFWLKLHWSLFLGVQLTMTQHWFRQWPAAGQATSHYLNQCWPYSLKHICGNGARWVKAGSSGNCLLIHFFAYWLKTSLSIFGSHGRNQ